MSGDSTPNKSDRVKKPGRGFDSGVRNFVCLFVCMPLSRLWPHAFTDGREIWNPHTSFKGGVTSM